MEKKRIRTRRGGKRSRDEAGLDKVENFIEQVRNHGGDRELQEWIRDHMRDENDVGELLTYCADLSKERRERLCDLNGLITIKELSDEKLKKELKRIIDNFILINNYPDSETNISETIGISDGLE